MLSRKLILPATFIVSLLALWISFQQTSQTQTHPATSIQSTQYSWQLFNSTTWQTQKEQHPSSSTLYARTFFYNESAKTSDFTEPFIALFKPDQTVFIQSQLGHTVKHSQLELSEAVRLFQFDQPIHRLANVSQNKNLLTEHITYNSNTQLLSSQKPITLTQNQTTLTGTGMTFDLNTHQLKLLSGVSGVIHP